jgi:hypothetical protein
MLKGLLTTKHADNIKAEIIVIQAEAHEDLAQAKDALPAIINDDELKKHLPTE